MADRYWVGGSGTWDTVLTTNWSATSGGAGGASVPTTADSVFFNQAATYTVTMTGALECLNITVSAGTVTFAQGTLPTLSINGSMSLRVGTVWNLTGAITFTSTVAGETITNNGVTLKGAVTFNGSGGSWTLGSAFTTTGPVTLTTGTLDTSAVGNYAFTCGTFVSISGLPSALNMNASAVTATGNLFSLNGAGVVLSAGTSQITMTSASLTTFNGNSNTFYNVAFTAAPSSGTIRTINGDNVFNTLSFSAPSALRSGPITFGGNQTINGTLIGSGATAIRRLFYRSSVLGSPRTLTLASATTLSNCDFRDITAVTNAITATGGGDCGGNTNVTGFPAAKTVYWNLTGTQVWSATAWAASSGGAPALANFPLAQDTAIINNAGAATSINQGTIGWNIGTLDMSLRTTAVTFSTSTGGPDVYGDWLNGTGVTLAGNTTVNFSGYNNTQQILGNGRTFSQVLNKQNTGTLRLIDDVTTASNVAFFHSGGILDLNGKTLTVGTTYQNNSTATKNLTFNGGTLVCPASSTVAFNLAFTVGYSTTAGTGVGTISMTGATAKTFIGGGITYNCTINQGGAGALTITGNNTFANITNTVQPASVLFEAGTTNTFAAFNLNGTAGNLITIGSDLAASHTLSKASGAVLCNYLSISRSSATGGATWTALSSTDGGNNTGWAFSLTPTGNTGAFFSLLW